MNPATVERWLQLMLSTMVVRERLDSGGRADAVWREDGTFARIEVSVPNRWAGVGEGESGGWEPPPEVTDRVMAIRAGDEVVLSVPQDAYPPGWSLAVTVDSETGEHVVVAQGDGGRQLELYRTPAGADLTLRTGAREDTIDIRNGSGVTVLAGAGDDEVWVGDSDDTVLGLAGNDTLGGEHDSPAGRHWISGGAGADSIYPSDDGGTALGGAGPDAITSGDRDLVNGTRISGGEGNDEVHVQRGGNTVDGDAGRDYLTSQNSYATNPDHGDVLRGGPGGDHIETSGMERRERVTVDGQGGADTANVGPLVDTSGIDSETGEP